METRCTILEFTACPETYQLPVALLQANEAVALGMIQMSRFCKQIIGGALLISICTILSSLGQEMPKSSADAPLLVELSAKKSTIRPGEALRLIVILKNQTSDVYFIDRSIEGGGDRLTLYLQQGSEVDRSVTRTADDYFIANRTTPFATLLSQHWIALGPGKFYGGEVDMNPSDFPRLRTPGRYLVKFQYGSKGFHEPADGNPLRGREDEISKLPYKAWEGETESNSVKVEVTTRAKGKSR